MHPAPSPRFDQPLRVAVNATPLAAAQLRGWTRYTVNLLAALPRQGVRPILLARGPLNPAHLDRLPGGSFDLHVAPPMNYLRWEQRWVPRSCRTAQAHLYHCPLNFGVPIISPVPRVLTLHDAIGQTGSPRRPWRERWLRSHLTAWAYHRVARTMAERIITVSDHARSELLGQLHLQSERVTVVAEAADPIFLVPVTEAQRDDVRAKWGLHQPFLFYVGGWEERKNLPFLLRGLAAASLPDVALVLAGGHAEQKADLAELAGALGIADRVRLLGFVPESDLPALYAAALGFVYPSRHEGFGLQLVEAMAVGCPVLAARSSCLPEVLGDGGATFALDRPDELAGQIRRLATDPAYRADLVARASRRATDFSWDQAAAATVAVYRSALGGRNS